MTTFKGENDLFIVLKVKHIPKKHWSDFTRWGIVEIMNELFKSIYNVIVVADFIFISVNEVITIDNTSWISMHLYIVRSWK
jgi:hypothetical protein